MNDNAYWQGFVKACEDRGIDAEAVIKSAKEPTRTGAYASSMLPLGAMLYPASKASKGRSIEGLLRGSGYDIAGTAAGSLAGSAGGAAAGAIPLLIKLLTKGKTDPSFALNILPAIGGVGGGLLGAGIGGGEGVYRAAKRVSKPEWRERLQEWIARKRG